MSYEKELRSRCRVLRDEMPSTMERRTVHPVCSETQRVQLTAQHVGDTTDASEVHGAAVDVDDALQQRERPCVFGVDGASHGAFVCG
jgi:hypothetical protein